tara:strand:+ start:8751 stop:9407 length:657 start_codon:yes stop_codon:yes gene_type:complete
MIIDLDFNEEDMEAGVFAISVVNDPAIKSDFLTLSSEESEVMNLAAIDDKKYILMGAVLIPDLIIPRANGTQIRFSKEVIRKASEVYFKRGHQQDATLEHKQDEKLAGMTVVESWIVEDTKHDKSAMYGLDAPVGSWVVSMKCDNDEVYELAKQGQINGFSIEGIFPQQKEVSLSEILDNYSPTELQAMSDMCELAEKLADTKDEAKDFIKQLMRKTI